MEAIRAKTFASLRSNLQTPLDLGHRLGAVNELACLGLQPAALDLLSPLEAEIGLVNERSALERMVRTLAREKTP